MAVSTNSPEKRFFALDALRGVAALGVVVWHYQNFGNRPFWKSLLFFHVYGISMVVLFFVLSGFIFFLKYSNDIHENRIGFKRFFWLRLTRLYPLHFVTLILAGAGQYYFFTISDKFFLYPNQDLKHFTLNILFISSWGFESNHSFNLPAWSISIEILLYLIFYFYCSRIKTKSLAGPVVMIFLGWQLCFFNISFYIFNVALGAGLVAFFAGGLACQFFNNITAYPQKNIIRFSIVGFVALAYWMLMFWFTYTYGFAQGMKLYDGLYFFSALIGFPATVLFFALVDHQRVFAVVFKKLAFWGDISYSVYLIHFPVQLLFVGISLSSPIDFSQEWVFLLYFSTTISLAIASHKWLEIPCQRYLRSKFSGK